MANNDPFPGESSPADGRWRADDLSARRSKHLGDIDSLPYTIKVLLESALRNHDGEGITDEDVQALAQYDATKVGETEVAFAPARVVLQDFTGVPAIVDLAAMRSAIVRMTGDEPQRRR